MPERTAGQRAYETYAALLQAQWPMAVWSGLSALERYAWEAAAEAAARAVVAWEEEKKRRLPHVPRAQGRQRQSHMDRCQCREYLVLL